MKKFITSLCLIASIVVISFPYAKAETPRKELAKVFNSNEYSRFIEVAKDKITETAIAANDTFSDNIANIKIVRDFANNEFLVVETKPTGYLLYNVESGVFAERSPVMLSPYNGYEDNLYYGGIGSYYQQRGDTYYHLLDDVSTPVFNPKENSGQGKS